METLEKFIVPQKNEKWRFSGLKTLELKGYEDAQNANSFKATPGVEIISGKELTKADREALTKSFIDFGSQALQQQANSPHAYGVVVRIPAGKSGEAHLYATTLDDKSFFKGHALAEVATGATLTVIENLSSPKNDNLYVNTTRLKVAEKGVLNYILTQDFNATTKSFNFLEIEAHKDAQVNVTILNLGSGYVRQELTAIMKGQGANVQMRSLSIVRGAQEIDQRTLQIHEAPNAKSDLLFKNILDDKARTIFSGLIRVAPGAQKTDAYQKNRNLMLSEDAQANSLPGLEIEANDVRCTHGATCGRLDANELFYLRARGINEREAKRMLVGGYAEEIISGLPEELQAWAHRKMEERLG